MFCPYCIASCVFPWRLQLLENPTLFSAATRLAAPDCFSLAREYLAEVRRYPCADKYVRQHLFKLLFRPINLHTELRDTLGNSRGIEQFEEVVETLAQTGAAAGNSVDFYAQQPSWYRRHRNQAAALQQRTADKQAALAAAQEAEAGPDEEGLCCLFDE